MKIIFDRQICRVVTDVGKNMYKITNYFLCTAIDGIFKWMGTVTILFRKSKCSRRTWSEYREYKTLLKKCYCMESTNVGKH